MNNQKTPDIFLRGRAVLTGVALLLWSTLCLAGQSSTPLTFSATFLAGTCDITVIPSTVDWGSVSSSSIRLAGKAGTASRDLTVRYAKCSGYGRAPRLSVIGTTLKAGIPLFTRTDGAPGSARGYGVRLVSAEATTTALGNGDSISVGTPGDPLSKLEKTETVFQASLSCGDCSTPDLHGGALSATVTFQFLYQ